MNVLSGILNLLYPKRCACCGEILRESEGRICPACRKKLRPITGPCCLKCGRPVEAEEEYCAECLRTPHFFRQGRSAFVYDDVWKKSIERFKYYGYREFGDFYSEAMVRVCSAQIRAWRPDMIIPVPLHRSKQRKRGFNQSWYLAERIGRLTGIPADPTLVKKTRRTASQKKLNAAERRRNLAGAFQITGNVRGMRILVVDDVYTTGSTMDAMAKTLLPAGAEEVFFLTFCIGFR